MMVERMDCAYRTANGGAVRQYRLAGERIRLRLARNTLAYKRRRPHPGWNAAFGCYWRAGPA